MKPANPPLKERDCAGQLVQKELANRFINKINRALDGYITNQQTGDAVKSLTDSLFFTSQYSYPNTHYVKDAIENAMTNNPITKAILNQKYTLNPNQYSAVITLIRNAVAVALTSTSTPTPSGNAIINSSNQPVQQPIQPIQSGTILPTAPVIPGNTVPDNTIPDNQKPEIYIYFLYWGDSNAQGSNNGPIEPYGKDAPNPDILQFDRDGNGNFLGTTSQAQDPLPHFMRWPNSVGFGLTFAKDVLQAYQQAYPNAKVKLLLHNCGYGGARTGPTRKPDPFSYGWNVPSIQISFHPSFPDWNSLTSVNLFSKIQREQAQIANMPLFNNKKIFYGGRVSNTGPNDLGDLAYAQNIREINTALDESSLRTLLGSGGAIINPTAPLPANLSFSGIVNINKNPEQYGIQAVGINDDATLKAINDADTGLKLSAGDNVHWSAEPLRRMGHTDAALHVEKYMPAIKLEINQYLQEKTKQQPSAGRRR